ncbi:MAG: hypothetical protein V1926_00885 [Candidatus Peregrinibacteria bacterium]
MHVRLNIVIALIGGTLFALLFGVLSYRAHTIPPLVLRGSLTKMGTTLDNKTLLDVSFDDGTASHTLAADSAAFVVTPDDPSISHGAPLSVAFDPNDSSILGYQYTTRAAAIENEGKALFRDRFPGEFFGSPDQQTAFAGFAAENGIVIHPLDEVTLERNARYFIRTFGAPVEMTVRGLAWCGDGTVQGTEACSASSSSSSVFSSSSTSSSSHAALPQCSDGIDNDGDGGIDMPENMTLKSPAGSAAFDVRIDAISTIPFLGFNDGRYFFYTRANPGFITTFNTLTDRVESTVTVEPTGDDTSGWNFLKIARHGDDAYVVQQYDNFDPNGVVGLWKVTLAGPTPTVQSTALSGALIRRVESRPHVTADGRWLILVGASDPNGTKTRILKIDTSNLAVLESIEVPASQVFVDESRGAIFALETAASCHFGELGCTYEARRIPLDSFSVDRVSAHLRCPENVAVFDEEAGMIFYSAWGMNNSRKVTYVMGFNVTSFTGGGLQLIPDGIRIGGQLYTSVAVGPLPPDTTNRRVFFGGKYVDELLGTSVDTLTFFAIDYSHGGLSLLHTQDTSLESLPYDAFDALTDTAFDPERATLYSSDLYQYPYNSVRSVNLMTGRTASGSVARAGLFLRTAPTTDITLVPAERRGGGDHLHLFGPPAVFSRGDLQCTSLEGEE